MAVRNGRVISRGMEKVGPMAWPWEATPEDPLVNCDEVSVEIPGVFVTRWPVAT